MFEIDVLELENLLFENLKKEMSMYNVSASLQALIVRSIAGQFEQKAMQEMLRDSANRKFELAREEENAKQRAINSEGSD
jgi:hypothetical protein